MARVTAPGSRNIGENMVGQESIPGKSTGTRQWPWPRRAGWGITLGLVLLWTAPTAQGADVVISRDVFNSPDDRPLQQLAAGEEMELKDEIRQVRGVTRLRVENADEETPPVFRFREQKGLPGVLTMTVILVSLPGHFDYRYRKDSQQIRAGLLIARKEQPREKMTETELEGEPGRVAAIRVQDDLLAELRLRLEGETLVIRQLTSDQGGNPTGGRVPPYFGKKLRFMDYTVLLAGFTDNRVFDVSLGDFAIAMNYLSAGETTAILARVAVRQQVARWERLALWLEGGAGYYSVNPADSADTIAGTPTWSTAINTEYRLGNWGAAGNLSYTNGAALAVIMGGWQFSRRFGAMLEMQTFQGLTGYGLGLTMAF